MYSDVFITLENGKEKKVVNGKVNIIGTMTSMDNIKGVIDAWMRNAGLTDKDITPNKDSVIDDFKQAVLRYKPGDEPIKLKIHNMASETLAEKHELPIKTKVTFCILYFEMNDELERIVCEYVVSNAEERKINDPIYQYMVRR